MTPHEFMLRTAVDQTVHIVVKPDGVNRSEEMTVKVPDYIHSPAPKIQDFRMRLRHWEVHGIRVEKGILTITLTAQPY